MSRALHNKLNRNVREKRVTKKEISAINPFLYEEKNTVVDSWMASMGYFTEDGEQNQQDSPTAYDDRETKSGIILS